MRAIYLVGGPEDGRIMTAEHLGSLTIPPGYADCEYQSSSHAGRTWQDANYAIFVSNKIPHGLERQLALAAGRAELIKAFPHLR